MAKPGERKLQILQVLAQMLEIPKVEKATTAALAKRLDCSEAALYRHFASKAHMFEGLIEFIETTLFGMINKISVEEELGIKQLEHILHLLLSFPQKNKGMTRVLTGDALVHEDPRLQTRINLLQERLEASLKQALRIASTQNDVAQNTDFSALANVLMSFVIGHWQQFAKSGFTRDPLAKWNVQWPLLKSMCAFENPAINPL